MSAINHCHSKSSVYDIARVQDLPLLRTLETWLYRQLEIKKSQVRFTIKNSFDWKRISVIYSFSINFFFFFDKTLLRPFSFLVTIYCVLVVPRSRKRKGKKQKQKKEQSKRLIILRFRLNSSSALLICVSKRATFHWK